MLATPERITRVGQAGAELERALPIFVTLPGIATIVRWVQNAKRVRPDGRNRQAIDGGGNDQKAARAVVTGDVDCSAVCRVIEFLVAACANCTAGIPSYVLLQPVVPGR